MDMSTQNCSLLQHKGNFPEKSKNKETTQICLKYNLSTSVLSTLMTYVKNISNWPDQEGKNGIRVKIIHFHHIREIFLEKLKTREAHEYDKNIT